MLVKMRSGTNTDGWVIYDHIVKVHHCKVTSKEQLEAIYKHSEVYNGYEDFDPANKLVYLSLFKDESNDYLGVLAYSPVFVLNDSGQTIDRI